MSVFKKLFGIEEAEINKTCILLPMINKELLSFFKAGRLSRGKLYGCLSCEDFTLIHTGIGCGFVGDAILYLKNTRCKNIILFGSCGSVGRKRKGDIVAVNRCFLRESFTDMLLDPEKKPRAINSDEEFLKVFFGFLASHKKSCSANIEQVVCSTLASLKLEDELIEIFKGEGVDVVDMECSAFFAAAKECRMRALSLFYVSDVIKVKPFFEENNSEETRILRAAVRNAAEILCQFAQKDSTGN